MGMLQQHVAQLNALIQMTQQQKVCIDYLKQYNDVEYEPMFKFIQMASQYQQNDTVTTQLRDSVMAL